MCRAVELNVNNLEKLLDRTIEEGETRLGKAATFISIRVDH